MNGTRQELKNTSLFARDGGGSAVHALDQNDENIVYNLAKFGCRLGQYAEDLGLIGDDVWHVHSVILDASEIDLFARTKTGVVHCPCTDFAVCSRGKCRGLRRVFNWGQVRQN